MMYLVRFKYINTGVFKMLLDRYWTTEHCGGCGFCLKSGTSVITNITRVSSDLVHYFTLILP